MRKQILTIGASAAAVIAAVSIAPPSASAGPVSSGASASDIAGSGSSAPRVLAGQGTTTPSLVSGLSEATAGKDAISAAKDHLAKHRSRYRIAVSDLAPVGTIADTVSGKTTETVRFGQRYKGIPVFGAQYLVHLSKTSSGRTATGAGGRYFDALSVGTSAKVSKKTAIARAKDVVLASLAPTTVSVKDRKTPSVSATAHGLVVIPRGKGVLTQWVTVRTLDPVKKEPVIREVYLDANAGFPVLSYSKIQNEQVTGTGENLQGKSVPLNVYQLSDGTYETYDGTRAYPANGPGVSTYNAIGLDVAAVSGRWPSGAKKFTSDTSHFAGDISTSGGVEAHVNAGHVVDYYKNQFGRNGIDGQGGPAYSFVGVTYFGQPFVNAFWDGSKMVYGGGDSEYYPLSADLDVVGHEMTHGVIEHSANLVYMGQSGAMNEALADYFGNAIDANVSGTPMDSPAAGLIGEDLCRSGIPKDCAFRDLNDGATTLENFLGLVAEQDSGGVHYNSTIFSGALWDIREKLDPALADKLVYKALTEYMTPLDGFTEGRQAVLSAAAALGLTKAQVGLVTKAFNAHGISPGWEKKLGVDSTTLFADVNTERTGAQASNGWWVTSSSNKDGSEPYSIYAGRTDKKTTPIRLSPNDGRFHVYPHTDGKNVVWAAWGDRDIQIMTRAIDRGPVKVLWTLGYSVSHLRIDGGTVAWQVTHPIFGSKVQYYRTGWSEPRFADNGGYSQSSYFPSFHDGKLAFVKRWYDPALGKQTIGPFVKDVDAGTDIRFPDAGEAAIGLPTLTSKKLVWLLDKNNDRMQASIVSADRDGTGFSTLVDETAPGAPLATRADASEEAVTYDSWSADGAVVNKNLPKLLQVPLTGGAPQRVSCNRGSQVWFASDEGTRVVWLDGTTGHTNLVTRSGPTTNC